LNALVHLKYSTDLKQLAASGRIAGLSSHLFIVMPGLVPGIHENRLASEREAWMAGTSPAMTA
jgi:hypothetical protein